MGSGMLYAPGATAFKSSSQRNFIVSPYTFGTATRFPSACACRMIGIVRTS